MSISFKQAQFVTSAFELSQLLPDEGVEIAFAGRSNAGKSSAINFLTRQKSLCKTSRTPGRTQLINFFALDEEHRLVDLPGFGYAKVSKKLRNHWNEVLSTFLLQRQALKGMIIVVDIRRGIRDLDQVLIDMLGDSVAVHILLTKSDKLSRSATLQAISEANKLLSNRLHTVSALSIVNQQGLDVLEQKCRSWLEPETEL